MAGTQGQDGLILFVEDDDVLAAVVIELLTPLGEIVWAPSAEQAVAQLSLRPWDLLLSDIDLPGMNGHEMVRHAKSAQPDLAVLMLSGHASFDHAVEAIRAGADDYLTKPVQPPKLVAKARELMALTRDRRAKGRERVLAVGAHPDDVEIGVGGILLRHSAAGHEVAVLTLTGGEQGGEAAERAAESQLAAELMGARLFHTDLSDTSVSDGGTTISVIKRVIDQVLPTTVYTHTSKDVHQDHRNVHHATLVAARGIPRVYCYQAPSTTVEFKPTKFVAIDPYVDRKLEVIRAFASQTAVRAYLDEELMRSTARYWSRFTQARYVEPLEVVREADTSADDSLSTLPQEVADAR
ncbi:response regulator [Conexibacter sp. JD483]|uniref:PIG-L family deacetylase n=1 Tax=unclassified Conexibacter TaxID=2627773 RepID=UPI00271C2113|nr:MULTISPECIES: PIG-L family deacetylase [unclassified Conexibacter]MDO8184995.1 response regulator [Conexibacter sp. CPCC 205706]MDO8198139.1 response regulator [Conexibacter sp. CPCC 205762]MDR9368239.1 response regulator [Conexibacter sp. JD483]